jgi:hypothetical protein
MRLAWNMGIPWRLMELPRDEHGLLVPPNIVAKLTAVKEDPDVHQS